MKRWPLSNPLLPDWCLISSSDNVMSASFAAASPSPFIHHRGLKLINRTRSRESVSPWRSKRATAAFKQSRSLKLFALIFEFHRFLLTIYISACILSPTVLLNVGRLLWGWQDDSVKSADHERTIYLFDDWLFSLPKFDAFMSHHSFDGHFMQVERQREEKLSSIIGYCDSQWMPHQYVTRDEENASFIAFGT